MVAQNMLRAYDVNLVIAGDTVSSIVFENKFGFDDSFDVTKCLQNSEIPDFLYMCA